MAGIVAQATVLAASVDARYLPVTSTVQDRSAGNDSRRRGGRRPVATMGGTAATGRLAPGGLQLAGLARRGFESRGRRAPGPAMDDPTRQRFD